MTFSSFDAYPGLELWHSRDLVNWRPRGAALRTNVGSVWAAELCRHEGLGFDDTHFVTRQYGLGRGRPAHRYGRSERHYSGQPTRVFEITTSSNQTF